MKELKIYGTLGPSCNDEATIHQMYEMGMIGMRLNLSHMTLEDAKDWLEAFHNATDEHAELLIDMQGPELRIGKLEPVEIKDDFYLEDVIPVPETILDVLSTGQEILLDDGKISLTVLSKKEKTYVHVNRGGILTSSKSIALPGIMIPSPTLTDQDIENLRNAKKYGVTGIMQPFVRNAKDLQHVRNTLKALDLDLRIFAKVENLAGVDQIESLIPYCDEIIIARGDLGNATGLINLPSTQHKLQNICKKYNRDYMIVTQMLDSMIHNPVPTRAEVTDVYEAVYQGASSIMLTGETAGGKYPVEAMRYFVEVAKTALKDRTANTEPSMEQWIKEAKKSENADKVGMYLVHNGVVRATAKAKVRQDAKDTLPVTGMYFDYDQDKVEQAIQNTYKMDGIYYIKVWLNHGDLAVGDSIMYVMIGGDIRPHVIDALQSLVGYIKNECVIEKEKNG